MIFKRYRFSILIQLIVIALTMLAFFWAIQQEYMLITSISLIILWILEIIFLLWFLQKINRDLIKFITALKYDDVSINFNNDKHDPYFNDLYKELNNIIKEISEIRSEKESEYQYFLNIVKHINTGIIAFDKNGKIEIYNNAALQLLKASTLKSITDIDEIKPGLSKSFREIKPGTTKLIKLLINNEIIQLSIKAADFVIKSRKIKLLSLQNIKTEIDHSEVDAWQKLIRVLTHEIMNSVSPIKLLSGSLIEMFEENNKIKTVDEIENSTIENSLLGLKTIRKRSDGLSNFVETYKSLTQIPKAKFSEFDVCNLFSHIETLLNNDFTKDKIKLVIDCNPEKLILYADDKLIEQVLINLLKNAAESLKDSTNPIIKLESESKNGIVEIRVIDNGPGIPEEVIENIFIPFFTTKEKGSGIGLSLSRQIMHLHGGNIFVRSEPGKETVFTLQF